MNKYTKNLLIVVLAFAAANIAFFFLPVPSTVFENVQDDNLAPLGEILPASPLVQCSEEIRNFTVYTQVKLELLLATYNRLNTAHYDLQVFVTDQYTKTVLFDDIFSASSVADNKYRDFIFPMHPTTPGKLCFSLSTDDAAAGNAITVWLNGNNDPVYKISANTTLPDLLTRMSSRINFNIGREALFGLFFVYLLAQIWLIIFLAVKCHEPEKIPKPAHHHRAGKG